MRDLAAVFDLEDTNHLPLPEAQAFLLLSVDHWRRARLENAHDDGELTPAGGGQGPL